jgi:group I intron endonuclease
MPGCYRLTNNATGHFYIGSTADFEYRLKYHRYDLIAERHKNKKFQTVFVGWEHITIELFDTDTVEEARILEQQMIDQFIGTALCCNQATSVSDPTQGVLTPEIRSRGQRLGGIRLKGIPKSAEHKEKISKSRTGILHTEDTKANISLAKSSEIEIDGVVYRSASIAAATLGINYWTLKNRLRSTKEKFKGWKRL